MRYSQNGRPIIVINWWDGALTINGQLFIWYSKREALKLYREQHELKNKKCVVIDYTAKN